MKLNLGAGGDVLAGWTNHDLVKLTGIDCAHDLNVYPWPWASSSVEKIKAYDVLEHLDQLVPAMDELWRILVPGGLLDVSVPYWNSYCYAADPTHRRGFHELTFRFFDPDSPYCAARPYYAKARFKILNEKFVLAPFQPYFSLPGIREILVEGKFARRLVGFVGNYFVSNLIHDIRIVLQKV